MSWVLHEGPKNASSSSQYFSTPSPPHVHDQSFDSRINLIILLIVVILAVVLFITGLIYLIVRRLVRPLRGESEDLDNVRALRGQLQQLLHLHDAGLDQSFIDTLPVFLYKTIVGVKNPLDCAVCLCEFETDDKLRLLPKCSHGFHLECIDTWLLSHSTCPLCRGSLVPDSPSDNCTPIVRVLESGSESSREMVDRESVLGAQMNLSSEDGFSAKNPGDDPASEETKIVPVKLGKLRNIDGVNVVGSVRERGESSSSVANVDSSRCYSMGYFEYVLDESSFLQVPVSIQRPALPSISCHRPVISMYESSKSRRDNSSVIEEDKRESFSISKIWLRSKRDNAHSSRRAYSFRLPARAMVDMKLKQCGSQSTVSEIEVECWMNNHGNVGSLPTSECDLDDEFSSFHSMDARIQSNPTPSFARRTLNWIVGRSQNRVIDSNPSPPV